MVLGAPLTTHPIGDTPFSSTRTVLEGLRDRELRGPETKGAVLAAGTDLEPPRAGKDPDLRSEEMLEGTAEERRAEEGGAKIQADRHKRNKSENACGTPGPWKPGRGLA